MPPQQQQSYMPPQQQQQQGNMTPQQQQGNMAPQQQQQQGNMTPQQPPHQLSSVPPVQQQGGVHSQLSQAPGGQGDLIQRFALLEQRVAVIEAENERLRAVTVQAGADSGAAGGTDASGTLRMHVIGAAGLEAKDEGGTSDPFVKVTVVKPSGSKQSYRTQTCARTLSPEWNHQMAWLDVPRESTILVDVFDEDPGDVHELIGQVKLKVADLLNNDDVPAQTYGLVEGAIVLAAGWSTSESVRALVDKALTARPKPDKRKTDWRVAKDAQSGKEYYYHRKTKQTTWDMPAELKEFQDNGAGTGLSNILPPASQTVQPQLLRPQQQGAMQPPGAMQQPQKQGNMPPQQQQGNMPPQQQQQQGNMPQQQQGNMPPQQQQSYMPPQQH